MQSALSWAGYAAHTKKTPRESREEIEVALERYGANGFAYAHDDDHEIAWVAFAVDKVRVRVMVNLPHRADCRSESAYEQKVRSRWRMFLLLTRARLEAVANRVQTVEEAFLPDLVTASGATVSEVLRPALAVARAAGRLPVLGVGAAPLALPARSMSAKSTRHEEVREAEFEADDDDDDDDDDEEDADGDDDDEPPPSAESEKPRRGRPRKASKGTAETEKPRRGRPRGKGSMGSHRDLDATVPNQEVVPVDRLTRRSDHFACGPLGWTLRAEECLDRRRQAAEAMRRQGKAGVCFGCGQGAQGAQRLTAVARAA